MPTITTRVARLLKQTERMREQAVKSLLRTLKQIDQERKQRTADLEEAAKVVLQQLAEMGHIVVGNAVARAKKATATKATTPVKKLRIRRSPDQLKAEATKVLAIIRKAWQEGVGGP